MNEDLETVKKMYKLSDEEHKEIEEKIKMIMLFDKYPVENPRAIIDIAPPASGKTGLNGYGQEQFEDNNVVIINSDELKPFHPKIDEIAKLYPEYYTKVTDQESNTWTSALFDEALKRGYNVIFEGTGRNARILDTIKEKMQGYHVTVRGMSVNELNCLYSILERYEAQVATKGWGRLVTLSHFYETYNEMPNTIEKIEESGIIDSVEIYKRGSTPNQPVKIYDSTEKELGRFRNSKFAVLGGRIEDEKIANDGFENKINSLQKLFEGRRINVEEKEILMQIIKMNEEYKKKRLNEKDER